MGTKQFSNYDDLLTFTRASKGHALRPVSYGDELVTNGDTFSSGWTTSGWTFPSEQASVTGNGTNQNLYGTPVSNAVAGKLYQLSYEVISSSVAAGNLRAGAFSGASFFGGSYFTLDTTVGTHVLNFVGSPSGAGSVLDFWLYAGAASGTLVIDNISVKEVTFDEPDGTLTLFEHPNNVPRVEYDADGNRLGLLVEESRTNLIEWSNVFSQWNLTRATITENVALSPDGTQNATLLTATDDDARLQYTAGDINIVNTASIWVKSATGSDVSLQMDNGGLDIDTFTANSEWQRFENVLSTTGVANPRCRLRILNSGDAVYVYQGQLEAGSFMTSVITTSGSTATRSADVASIPVADFGYNQSAGSLVVEATALQVGDPTSSQAIAEIGTSNRSDIFLFARKSGTSESRFLVNDGANQSDLKSADFVGGVTSKMAGAYKLNDFAMSMDGGTVETDTSGNLPQNVSVMGIGTLASLNTNYLNGHIKSIKYYPRRLTNAQLQALTS